MFAALKDRVLGELAKGTHTEAFADGARFALTEAYNLAAADEIAVRNKIAEWYGAEWNSKDSTFYETDDTGTQDTEDEGAMHAYRGFKWAQEMAQPVVDREALEKLAAEWKQSADEDERYLNKAHASEIHDVYASIRISREHADAVLALLNGGAK